jgi:hypothetical protein
LLNSVLTLGGQSLKSYLNNFEDIIRYKSITDFYSKGEDLRRLSVIRDKGLKNRPIAILDYWSQTSLLPLHDALMNTLKTRVSDATYNQNLIVKSISDRLNNKGIWFSCADLSSATDRFPLYLQKKILTLLTNESYAEAWANVMVSRPFKYQGSEYTYNTGQPMGAYSSWAMFTLSHHIIVLWSAWKIGKTAFKDYIVLGDDIVIFDREVADSYKQQMKLLDVKISETKTHEGSSFCEFAKRYFIISSDKSQEITGVSLPGFLASLDNPYLMALEFQDCKERSTLDFTSVPVTISLLNFLHNMYNKRSSDRLLRIIMIW